VRSNSDFHILFFRLSAPVFAPPFQYKTALEALLVHSAYRDIPKMSFLRAKNPSLSSKSPYSFQHSTEKTTTFPGPTPRRIMAIEARPLVEITKEALKVLNKEMGIVDTVRFINQFTTGYGDYTQDREQLFKDMTLDDIISAVKKKQTPHRN